QEYENFEIIVLDDGSSDTSLNIADSFCDYRIRIFSDGVHRGLAARLNEGLELAQGQYIARMDADDVCFPERFALQVKYLAANQNVDLLGCRAVVFQDNGQIIGLLPFLSTHKKMCAYPWRGIPLPHPTWLGKRDWFLRYRYANPEVIRAEDQELLIRSHSESCFACLDEVLLGYRQGPFNFRRTMIARRSLLYAQFEYFMIHGEWGNMFMSIGYTALKIILDGIAALPGAERLFFMRMAETAPAKVIEKLRSCFEDGKKISL
ncbi:MAG: glycosyltransferase, partial [Chlorobium sp.]|nr:glycosyltransferase [Chlorobium sp.]